MSLYPQSTSYAQVPYPVPSYAQPGVHGGYYQHAPPPPPPPQFFYVDRETFRHDYMARLAELTSNSRPIIQNLSILAQDYSRWAEIVGQCLETHIRRVPPWMKLPAFYVLDAISKNVYEPYARHFASFVIPLFLETYEQVDQSTRSKMEEMLLTWRTGAPNGKELFGIVPQIGIERGVWGGEPSHTGNSANGFHSGSGHINKSQVLSELEFTLGQKERALQANPYDTVSRNHLNVLHQLRSLVDAGVSQEELKQILDQLRNLVRSAAPPPPPPPPPVPAPMYPSSSYPAVPSYPNPSLPSATFPVAGPSYMQPPSIYPSFDHPKVESVEVAPQSMPGPSNPPVSNIASLFNALLKAGVVSNSGTPPGAGATSKIEAEEKPQPVDFARDSMREYRKIILAQDVKLTSADITKKRPHIVRFLYERLPVQCKQCGIRFADTSVGKKALDDHLDMHFRQNLKANQNIGRGHSRSWFVGVEDWVHDMPADTKGKGRAHGPRPLNAKAAAAAEVAKRDAELRALFVVVPPGDEAKSFSCPICKETLKSEFLEDDEEWVWKNAIKKDDRVFHATCHAEAVQSTNSLAARLRSEAAAHSSRSATPEVSSTRTTPPKLPLSSSTLRTDRVASPSPVAGVKRKAELTEDGTRQADGSPPVKRLAVSAHAS